MLVLDAAAQLLGGAEERRGQTGTMDHEGDCINDATNDERRFRRWGVCEQAG